MEVTDYDVRDMALGVQLLTDLHTSARPARTPPSAAHPIDLMDEVLRPLLGSMQATTTAVTLWQKLRRTGHLVA